jgi:methyl-accepting chemotaxis protein
VGQGVELVARTGAALQRIVDQVTEINTVVTEIAAGAAEQANGLRQVNTAVNQMDQVTQQNAAMVEESSAASHNLSQEMDGLARLISRFKVEEEPIRHAPRKAARQAAKAEPKGDSGAGGVRHLKGLEPVLARA